MNRRTDSHSTEFLFILLVLGMFVLGSMLLISLGTKEYRAIVSGMEENSNDRLTEAYLTQKIRRHRRTGAVTTDEVDGSPALLLSDEYQGGTYVTWIYVKDGYLRELTTSEGRRDFLPEAGDPILPAEVFELSPAGDRSLLITAGTPAEDGGGVTSFLVTVSP